MKKFLLRILIFSFLLVLLYPLYVFTASKVDHFVYGYPSKIKNVKGQYGHSWKRLREAKEYGDVDVLILGSSLAYREIDVRAFDSLGLKAFNLGSSSQTPLQASFLLDNYLDKLDP